MKTLFLLAIVMISWSCSSTKNLFIISEINHEVEYEQPYNGKLWERIQFHKLSRAVGHKNEDLGVINNCYIGEQLFNITRICGKDTIKNCGVDKQEFYSYYSIRNKFSRCKFIIDTIYVKIR